MELQLQGKTDFVVKKKIGKNILGWNTILRWTWNSFHLKCLAIKYDVFDKIVQ